MSWAVGGSKHTLPQATSCLPLTCCRTLPLCAGFPKVQSTFARVSGYCEQMGTQQACRVTQAWFSWVGWCSGCRPSHPSEVVSVGMLPLAPTSLQTLLAADYHSPFATVHEALQFRWGCRPGRVGGHCAFCCPPLQQQVLRIPTTQRVQCSAGCWTPCSARMAYIAEHQILHMPHMHARRPPILQRTPAPAQVHVTRHCRGVCAGGTCCHCTSPVLQLWKTSRLVCSQLRHSPAWQPAIAVLCSSSCPRPAGRPPCTLSTARVPVPVPVSCRSWAS